MRRRQKLALYAQGKSRFIERPLMNLDSWPKAEQLREPLPSEVDARTVEAERPDPVAAPVADDPGVFANGGPHGKPLMTQRERAQLLTQLSPRFTPQSPSKECSDVPTG